MLIMMQYWLRCYILGCSQGVFLHSEAGPGPEAKRLATFAVYGQHGPVLAFIVCVRASHRYSVVVAWYMALVEPRNGGTKTLCKRVSPGKQEIMIFIDNVPPLLYAAFLENPGQNISTYLHDNCIFNKNINS